MLSGGQFQRCVNIGPSKGTAAAAKELATCTRSVAVNALPHNGNLKAVHSQPAVF